MILVVLLLEGGLALLDLDLGVLLELLVEEGIEGRAHLLDHRVDDLGAKLLDLREVRI